MSWFWSHTSRENLATCHPLLQAILHRALSLSPFDLSIIEGFRNQERQNKLHRLGRSRLKWPHSLHNKMPSLALDVVPLPLDWENQFAFHVMCGVIFAAARLENIEAKGWRLRSGQDWSGNWQNTDQNFHDHPHFELRPL